MFVCCLSSLQANVHSPRPWVPPSDDVLKWCVCAYSRPGSAPWFVCVQRWLRKLDCPFLDSMTGCLRGAWILRKRACSRRGNAP